MSYSPIQRIRDHLSHQGLTLKEHADMRSYLLSYATQHPVKSGLFSPYFFSSLRIATTSVAILLVTLIGVTTQAARALPSQTLYPVKIWIEEFQSGLQKTPEATIAFEMERVNKRFEEATALALHDGQDATTTAQLQENLLASRDRIRNAAESLAESKPTVALQAFDQLATSFKSNGKILATLENHSGTEMSPLVLAAHETSQQLNTEKQRFEKIIIAQDTLPSRASLEEHLARITLVLEQQPDLEVKKDVHEDPSLLTKESEKKIPELAMKEVSPATLAAIQSPTEIPPVDEIKKTESLTPAISPLLTTQAVTTSDSLSEMVTRTRTLLAEEKYKEVFILLQQIDQQLDEINLTKKLEATYQVTTQPLP